MTKENLENKKDDYFWERFLLGCSLSIPVALFSSEPGIWIALGLLLDFSVDFKRLARKHKRKQENEVDKRDCLY